MTETPGSALSEWQNSMTDPFRDSMLPAGSDFPLRVGQCAEPVQDAPAFDPDMIDTRAAGIILPSTANFPHPILERVVRVGLAHIDATFEGNHPKYGAGIYTHTCHDSFPPVIISAVDALTLWEMAERAEELYTYWLHTFVRPDGTINYRGTSLSECGMLLTSARRLMKRGGCVQWLDANFAKLELIAKFLLERMDSTGTKQLVFGVPEDDEKDCPAVYFHNNAWMVRGLKDWSSILEGYSDFALRAKQIRHRADQLCQTLVENLNEIWPKDPADWWLRPTVEKINGEHEEHLVRITATRLGSYTNYRYWPELLSSGVLPNTMMMRIVHARLNSGGQFCGTTRFENHLDDWPLAEWLNGLWNLGLYDDFLLCLWGHVYYHQAQGHLTAYEQVTFPPGRQYKTAAYCLPCQLVAVRGAGYLTRCAFRRSQ
jgi:hypothetical protein